MGLDIGGNTIAQAGSVLTIDTGVPMRVLSAGSVVRPNQTQFIALGSQVAAYVNFVNATWNILPFVSAPVNINACFNVANSRFTAPVSGTYFFQVGTYLHKDGASGSYYWHPAFFVNGGHVRNVNTAYTNYRIKGHGIAIATYGDGLITQVYDLVAGDYVEPVVYSTGTPTNEHFPPYLRFTGFLLG